MSNIFESAKIEQNKKLETSKEDLIQLVTFYMCDEIYAINILNVQEIIRLTEITRVPNADSYIKGVINLRGKIIPIIDLRDRLAMPKKEYNTETRIVVIENDENVVGFIVDRVNHVLRIEKNKTETPPPMVNGLDSEYISSVANMNDYMIILLDLNKILE